MMKRYTVYIDERLHKLCNAIALDDDLSGLSELINELLYAEVQHAIQHGRLSRQVVDSQLENIRLRKRYSKREIGREEHLNRSGEECSVERDWTEIPLDQGHE